MLLIQNFQKRYRKSSKMIDFLHKHHYDKFYFKSSKIFRNIFETIWIKNQKKPKI